MLDLTVQEHSSCFLFPNDLLFVYNIEWLRKTFGLHSNGEFGSVCWFAVHIVHCRLLIKKRTEQISVLLYEWTREKHNSQMGSNECGQYKEKITVTRRY